MCIFWIFQIWRLPAEQQWSNDSATSAHDVFYEKVIEKVLHFTPDIIGVFKTLIHSDGKEGSDAFEEFMNKECIKNFPIRTQQYCCRSSTKSWYQKGIKLTITPNCARSKPKKICRLAKAGSN